MIWRVVGGVALPYVIGGIGGALLVAVMFVAAAVGWDFGFSQFGIDVFDPDPVAQAQARLGLISGYMSIVYVAYTTMILAMAGGVTLILWDGDSGPQLGTPSLVIVGVAALVGAVGTLLVDMPAVPGGLVGDNAAATGLVGGSVALVGAGLALMAARVLD